MIRRKKTPDQITQSVQQGEEQKNKSINALQAVKTAVVTGTVLKLERTY